MQKAHDAQKTFISKIVDHMVQKFERIWTHPSWWNLLIALPWALGIGLAIHEWTADRDVAKREQITTGTIIAHEPANHNRYGYRFSVSGKSFTGWASPRKEEPHIGQQVTVYYDPIDPAKNDLTDFAELQDQSLGPVPMLLFGIGGVALYIRYRRRKGPAPQESREN